MKEKFYKFLVHIKNMSLKIEQKLKNSFFTEEKPRVYTTGAFLMPMEVTIEGEKQYIWVVNEFNDDTYGEDGKICSPVICTTQKKNLIEY
jgi:hypothetical protein